MHAAMHDALNAITPRYARWTAAAPDEPPAADAAPEAAVAAAAHGVLVGLQPDQTAPAVTGFAVALTTALAAVPDGARKAAGVALGKQSPLPRWPTAPPAEIRRSAPLPRATTRTPKPPHRVVRGGEGLENPPPKKSPQAAVASLRSRRS